MSIPKSKLFYAACTGLLALIISFLVFNVYCQPKQTVAVFYDNPTKFDADTGSIFDGIEDDLDYEVVNRTYGLNEQKFRVIFSTANYGGVVGNILTMKRTEILGWEIANISTSFIPQDDRSTDELREEMLEKLNDDNLSSLSNGGKTTSGDRYEPVLSPDKTRSAMYSEDEGNPLTLDNGPEIDTDVYHFAWSDDNKHIYYVKIKAKASSIIKYTLSDQNKTTLVTKNSELLGFEVIQDILIYSSSHDVGIVGVNGQNQKVLVEFNQPILGSDEVFIPNIIASEDRTNATVEIKDEKFLETRKTRYIIISANGEIESDSEVIED